MDFIKKAKELGINTSGMSRAQIEKKIAEIGDKTPGDVLGAIDAKITAEAKPAELEAVESASVDGWQPPEHLTMGEVLQVRYDIGGGFTKGWWHEGKGKHRNAMTVQNATSQGIRIQVTRTNEGYLPWVVSYGWQQIVNMDADPSKPLPITGAGSTMQMGGVAVRQREGFRFTNPVSSLGAALEAAKDWVDSKEKEARLGITSAISEAV